MGLGIAPWVTLESRLPCPPAKITAFIREENSFFFLCKEFLHSRAKLFPTAFLPRQCCGKKMYKPVNREL